MTMHNTLFEAFAGVEKFVPYPHEVLWPLLGKAQVRIDSGVGKEQIPRLKMGLCGPEEGQMRSGDRAPELLAQCVSALGCERQPRAQSIGIKGFQPAKPAPGFEYLGVFEKIEQDLFVVSAKKHVGVALRAPVAQVIDYAPAVGAPVDIIPKKDRKMRWWLMGGKIIPDKLFKPQKQVQPPVNIAYRVNRRACRC